MKVNLSLALLLLVLALNYTAQAQEEMREQLHLLVDFKDEKGKVQLKVENKNQDINKPLNINLDSFDLEIRFVNFNKNHLVKFNMEDVLECEGLEFTLDTNMMSTGINITKGLLNLER